MCCSALREDGMTIVIIEHTMHAMMRIADRFVVLDHGRVLAQRTATRGGGGPRGDRGLSRQEMAGEAACLRSPISRSPTEACAR